MLFLLILGTIEAGRFILYYQTMNNAAREGARYAIVHGSEALCPSGPQPGQDLINPPDGYEPGGCPDFIGERIRQRVEEATIGVINPSDLTIYPPIWTDAAILAKPSPDGVNTGSDARGNYVSVFVDLAYRPLIATILDIGVLPDITISAESTLVINY
jgi:hypothetical protein